MPETPRSSSGGRSIFSDGFHSPTPHTGKKVLNPPTGLGYPLRMGPAVQSFAEPCNALAPKGTFQVRILVFVPPSFFPIIGSSF